MPQWRYTTEIAGGRDSLPRTHVNTYDNLLASRDEGLAHLPGFLNDSKSNYRDRLRWVTLEESEDGETWKEIKKLTR